MSVLELARLLRAAASLKKGKWRLGKDGGTLASDEEHDATDELHYGGKCLGESIEPSTQLYMVLAQPRNIERLVDAILGLEESGARILGLTDILETIVVQHGKGAVDLAAYGQERDEASAKRRPFPSFEAWLATRGATPPDTTADGEELEAIARRIADEMPGNPQDNMNRARELAGEAFRLGIRRGKEPQ